MTGNKTSRLSFAVQSAVGTEAIDDATDVTYLFGGRQKGQKWTSPRMIADVEKSGSYSSREVTLTPLEPEYKNWLIPYIPTTPQHLIRMMKQVTEDGISANIHKIEALDSGLPLPLTIRLDLPGGSVDRLYQTVNSYTVGLYWRAMKGSNYFCEEEFAFGRLEDRRGQWLFDDICASRAANSITLTNDADRTANSLANCLAYINGGDHEDDEYTITANTDADPTVLTTSETTGADLAADTLSVWDKLRPILTTPPVMPGYTAPNAYRGTPEVYWDVGDQNTALPRCWKVEGNHKQEHEVVLGSDSKYQTVYIYDMEPIMLTFEAVLESHKTIYDYIDRKVNQVNVKVYKPNPSYYINHKLYNCNIIDAVETGHAFKGLYNCRFIVKAESFIGEFTLESETNWSTHYKHVA